MEHNPTTVLAIGEVALFMIGTLLSIILLGILLLPSLARFTVPHWVKLNERDEGSDHQELFDLLTAKLAHHGYQVVSRDENLMVITKDGATRYHLYQQRGSRRLSLFRQGDETDHSAPTSILAGAGIGWVVILCHQTLTEQGQEPVWGWDENLTKTAKKPFSAIMEQVILLNPWR